MFARCARVAPAMAFRPSASAAAPASVSTCRCLSCCTTLMPLLIASVSVPLAPFTVTASAPIVALTPCGRSTGIFATRDMYLPLRLLNDEQHFAAGAGCARLCVGHDALGRGNDRHSQAAQNLGQFILAAIDAQSRSADALDAVDDGTAVVILELDRQRALRAGGVDAVAADVALVLQNLEDGQLQLRGADTHRGLARGLGIADTRQKIGNGISHAHSARLTSSPSKGRGSRRGWRPRAAWYAPARTCGTRRVNAR